MAVRKPGARAGSRTAPSRAASVLTFTLAATLAAAPFSARAEGDDRAPAGSRATLTSAERLELDVRRAGEVRPQALRWMSENFHLQKGTGFEYRHPVRLGDHAIELGIQGPVVRRKQGLGLTLVVRF